MADPYPTITFRVNLELKSEEQIGPNTNEKDVSILHPDLHQNSADRGRLEKSNRVNTRSSWNPGLLGAKNWALKDGDEFTQHGQQALYTRDTYAIGFAPADRAYLEIV